MKDLSIAELNSNPVVGEERNFPETGFISSNEGTEEQRVTISQKTYAIIKLSGFSLVQFLEGSLQEFEKRFIKLASHPETETSLYFKLLFYSRTATDSVLKITEIGLTRVEMKILKRWLEVRMSHCEQERKDLNPKFDPDTYIGMKILLIEIREWLLGEYVD